MHMNTSCHRSASRITGTLRRDPSPTCGFPSQWASTVDLWFFISLNTLLDKLPSCWWFDVHYGNIWYHYWYYKFYAVNMRRLTVTRRFTPHDGNKVQGWPYFGGTKVTTHHALTGKLFSDLHHQLINVMLASFHWGKWKLISHYHCDPRDHTSMSYFCFNAVSRAQNIAQSRAIKNYQHNN